MALKYFKMVILGAPASGKGTISSRIVNNFHLEHISSGDKLRMHMQNHTALGSEVKKYILNGQLVPDELMVKFINEEIKKLNSKNWLLDGFPRTLNQAQSLWKKQPVNLVINLNVPFDVIISRIKGRWIHLPSGRVYNVDFNAPKVAGKDDVTGEDLIQREDDKPEVVRKRLEDYEKLTGPVVEFYKSNGVLAEYAGKTTDEIWPRILVDLHKHLPVVEMGSKCTA